MRGIILAAGEGTRLRPLTQHKPKVMIKVANRPILEYVVEALVQSGVTELTLVVGYQRERVQTHFEDGTKFGAKIRYAFQDIPLGTAHALAQARSDEDALVVAGDNLIDARLVKDLLKGGDGVSVALQRSETPAKYGVVRLEGDRVLGLGETPKEAGSGLVSTGCYRFSAKAAKTTAALVKKGAKNLPDVLSHFIADGQGVRGVVSQGLWMEALYPWDLLRLNFELLQRIPSKDRAHREAVVRESAALGEPFVVGQGSLVDHNAVLGPGTAVGSNVTVGPGAIVENSILMDDVLLDAGTIVRNSIVGEGTHLGSRCLTLSGPCQVESAEGFHRLTNFGSVIGEDVRAGGNVVLEAGVTVGAGARIGANVVVRRNLPDGAVVL